LPPIRLPPAKPTLRFSPPAWSKLLYLRDRGPTEIGAYGIAIPGDPLFVTDIRLVQQVCSAVSVSFDDTAVADFFDEQVDLGRRPEEFSRIWLHTHPGDSAEPSFTDEETFWRCFGRTDWAVMFILARQGKTYARLRFNTGPGGSLVVQATVDFTVPFQGSAQDVWDTEYQTNVFPEITVPRPPFRMPEPDEILELWELGPEDPFVHGDDPDPNSFDSDDETADDDTA
jgi:hypothetical protein